MGRGRQCIECDRPLYPHEQGALCSECFYDAICTPGPAIEPDAGPGGTDLDHRTPAAPSSVTRRRERRRF